MQRLRGMTRGATRDATAALMMIGISGCLTMRQGAGIQADLAALHARLERVDSFDQEHRRQVVELREVLDRATALLATNSADIGAKEERAEVDIAALQKRVDSMTRALELAGPQGDGDFSQLEARIAALERSQATVVERVAPKLPDDEEQLWRQAGERMASSQSDEGRRFYRAFIARFPHDPRSSRACIELGRSYAAERQFSRAAAEFQRILDIYPRAPEAPEAMWELSKAFVELRFCTDARSLLRELVKRYPTSSPVPQAQRELRAITKLPRTACSS